ncbi:MAG: dihydroorotate dehydrogenase [Chloroflexota bacterium]|nr:dihydroorotate dehydrogenase [Chloroflexota bacterium]
MDLSVQLAPKNKRPLNLANPVVTASGTFGYGTDYGDIFDVQKLGAIFCKGTTLKPKEGNPQPRIAETPGGMLNAIGFQNIGVKALIKEKAPIWAKWRVPVIVNVTGDTVEEFAQIAHELDSVPGVSGMELNISCPNVKHGGMAFGTDPKAAAEVAAAVKGATSLPVIVKLSPNCTDITAIAVAVAEAGADALTVTNTLRGMAIDVPRRKPLLANVVGGLSGPAIKPVALFMVYQVAAAVKIPVIGCGGITTGMDAVEFIMAGATAVMVGTASLTTPRAALDVLEGLEAWMKKEGVKSLAEIRGAARPH